MQACHRNQEFSIGFELICRNSIKPADLEVMNNLYYATLSPTPSKKTFKTTLVHHTLSKSNLT